jgi:Tfp pilus assembly protein PilF
MKFSTDRRRFLVPVLLLAALGAAACVSPEKRVRTEKNSERHLALARKYMEMNRYAEALGQIEQALEADRKNADAILLRGQINFAQGRYAEAIADMDRTLAIRPAFTEVLSWRAWAKIESGDLPGAEADYRKALEDRIYPTPEKLWMNLGLLLIKEGRDSEGAEALRKAVQANPAYSRGHYELGKVQEQGGNVTGALISYQAAIGGMKDSADLNLRLGLMLEKNGDGSAAKAHFKRVLEISPTGPEAPTARDHLRRLEAPSS